MEKPGPVAFENGQARVFSDKPKLKKKEKAPHIKILLVNKL